MAPAVPSGGVVSIDDTRIGIIKALKKMASTSRAEAARLDDRFGGDSRYVRFNVEKGLDDTTLSDWKRASRISAHTRNNLSDNQRRVGAFVDAFLRRDWQGERTEGGGSSVPESPPRKPCRYLPFQKNRKFVGRASVMKTLKQKLFGDDDRTSHSVAIVGLGGVGKTQVALQMAYWILENKPAWHVFWVPALSMASFEQACRVTVQMAGLEGADEEDAKGLLQRYLGSDTSGRWFLIVDNIDDEEMVEGKEQGIRDFLPLTGRGRILFTTRVQDIAVGLAQTEVLDLSQMEEHEAIELLGRSLINRSLLEDRKSVAELLSILAHLPLAIAQAAAYLNVRKTSVAEYVRLLQNTERDMVELLETEFSDDTRYNPRQHETLCHLRAIFSTDLWEERERWRLFLPHVLKAIKVNEGDRRWVEEDNDLGYWVGRCLQAEGRSREAVVVLERVVAVRETALAETHPDRLASQHELARAYLADGRVKKAIELLERVVAVKETTLAETHPDRLSSQHALAGAYLADGRVKEAIELLERVVVVKETTLAETNPSRLASQHELARAYQADGRVKDAIELLERVVAVSEATLAETHPSRLASQHALAGAYQADGRVKDAIELLERVVAVSEATLAETHPDRLASQHNLATVYYDNGETKKAVALLEHVVNALKIVQSENHPQRIAAERWLDSLHSQQRADSQ